MNVKVGTSGAQVVANGRFQVLFGVGQLFVPLLLSLVILVLASVNAKQASSTTADLSKRLLGGSICELIELNWKLQCYRNYGKSQHTTEHTNL